MYIRKGRDGEMYVSRRAVEHWLDSYCKHIYELYGVDVNGDCEFFGGATNYDDNDGRPTSVSLNMDCLQDLALFEGVTVNEFAELMWAAKHEERHLWQYEQYKDPKFTDPFMKRMCDHFVIARELPEFYYAAYSKDPGEMDADAWSIRQTCNYFHENCLEYDIDRFFVEYFKLKPDYSRYSNQDFSNGVEMADTFDKLKHESKFKAVRGIFGIELDEGPSFMMKKLRKNQVLCNRIESCELLRDQKVLIGGFLRKEDPRCYSRYPILDPRGRSFTSSRAISKGFLNAVKNGGDGRVSSLYGYDGFEDYQKE